MIAHATTRTPGWFSIKEVSDRLAISPALMRLWESRYGWPSPRRNASGQRRFSLTDLDEIKSVMALIKTGRAIGSLIINGRPELPPTRVVARAPLAQDVLDALPMPQRPLARALRDELVGALRRRESHIAERILHQALRDCVPNDRARAVWLPTLALLSAWDQTGEPLPDAANLRALITAHGGPSRCAVAAATVDSGHHNGKAA
jgi:DNA-binding transcriptional MerR regulator